MIAFNKQPDNLRKIGRRKAQQRAHQKAQITINAVLWQIIRQNTKAEVEDFDATKPATLTIPIEDFKGVPQGFGLQVKQDKDGNVIIIANGVQSKSDLIVPGNRIIGV